MSKHTPGPWRKRKHPWTGNYEILGKDDAVVVAHADWDNYGVESEDDADLIAAAPDLLLIAERVAAGCCSAAPESNSRVWCNYCGESWNAYGDWGPHAKDCLTLRAKDVVGRVHGRDRIPR